MVNTFMTALKIYNVRHLKDIVITLSKEECKTSEAYKASKSEKNMRILRAIRDWSYKFAGFTRTVEAWYLDVDIDQSFKGKQLHMYKNILETEN